MWMISFILIEPVGQTRLGCLPLSEDTDIHPGDYSPLKAMQLIRRRNRDLTQVGGRG